MVRMLQYHNERLDAFFLMLGRAGFISRGFIWASVGAVAISAAFTGRKTQGTNGALEVIAQDKGGVVFLILITIGIFCYASWRFFEGLYGLQIKPDAKPFQQVIKGIVTPFCSCLAYTIFAVTNIAEIKNGISDPNGTQFSITADMLKYTIGKVALVIIAIFLFVAAIMWVIDLIRGRLLRDLDMKRLNKKPPVKIVTITLCYLGTFGRAILFCLLSVEFLRSVFDDSIRGGGFGVALQQLQYNTTARIFLVFFGFLIFLFGLFSVCQAFYKNFLPYHPHFLESNNRKNAAQSIKGVFGANSVTKELHLDDKQDRTDIEDKNNAALNVPQSVIDKKAHRKAEKEKKKADKEASKITPPTN